MVQENYNGIACVSFAKITVLSLALCQTFARTTKNNLPPFSVSILYFGYCEVNGAFVPVARRCR